MSVGIDGGGRMERGEGEKSKRPFLGGRELSAKGKWIWSLYYYYYYLD